MDNPLPKITIIGRVGVCLLTFAAGKLNPPLLSPGPLYGLSALGVMLILWEAVIYAADLVKHVRSKSDLPTSRSSRTPHPMRHEVRNVADCRPTVKQTIFERTDAIRIDGPPPRGASR